MVGVSPAPRNGGGSQGAADPVSPPVLRRTRRSARLALWWEALWLRVWAPLAVSGTFLALAMSGLPLRLSPALHAGLLAVFAAALTFALWRAGRGFIAPDLTSVDRRIETASGLRHRPLAALADRPVTDDPDTVTLWHAHLVHEAARSSRLRAGQPRPGLPRRDRRALRLGLVVALLAALVSAGDEAGERLQRAFLPALAISAPRPALRLEAWVAPPPYTGAAPLFLSLNGGEIFVPAGSALHVALSGDAGGVPELLLGDAAMPFRTLDGAAAGEAATSFGAEATLDLGGRLAIRRDGRELAAWSVAVRGDTSPSIAFSEPPGPVARSFGTRLPWRAEDDWGVQSARAELRLIARPDAPSLVVELPLPGGNPRSVRATAQPDLSAHPWAGLPVQARLIARDGTEQEGASETVTLTLPQRSFEHPVSRALVDLRRTLSLDPEARAPARAELDRISAAPEAFGDDTAAFLALRVARNRLLADRRSAVTLGAVQDVRRSAAAVSEAQQILWDVALALEEGRADRTASVLAEAQQSLREALDDRDPGKPEDMRRAEIERRIQELREAIRRHLEAMAERLQRENAEAMPRDPSSRMLDQRSLERRLERMQDAAREGRDGDTERELAEVQEMLRALREGRTTRAEDGERRQRSREQGQGQMGVVQDMVRRQSEALDRSHQRTGLDDDAPRDRRPSSRPSRAAPPADTRSDEQQSREERDDARTQRALRRALGELMQQFGDLTGEVPEPLGRADQAMRESAEALSRGGDARQHQERALRELAEGGREMAQSMQRQFGQGQDGEGQGEGAGTANGSGRGGQENEPAGSQGPGRDPLGRRTQELAGSGEEGGDTRVPEEAEVLRTRRLQDELRRRIGERERSVQELDYLDRLLRQF